MKKIIPFFFTLSSFFAFSLDTPYIFTQITDSIPLENNEIKISKEQNKNTKEIKENFLFKYWKLFGVLFILYIFMLKRTGNFFWPFFLFSKFFGYDRKYGNHKRTTNWTPFNSDKSELLKENSPDDYFSPNDEKMSSD